MRTSGKLLTAFAPLLMTSVVSAGTTYYQIVNNINLGCTGEYESKLAPNGTPVAGDLLVTSSNFYFRAGQNGQTTAKNYDFDIQLGERGIGPKDYEGGIMFKTASGAINDKMYQYFKKLCGVKGYVWVGTNDGSGYSGIRDTASLVVEAPKDDPFYFYTYQLEPKYFDVACPVSGGLGTGLEVRQHKNSQYPLTLWLTGDNSAYHGSWIVNGELECLFADSTEAFGATETSLVADALILRNGGHFGVRQGKAVTLPSSQNRGVTVESTGGALTTEADATLTLGCAMTGTGNVKKTGAGRLVLDGTWSCGNLTVDEGVLEFGPNAVFTKATTVTIRPRASCAPTAPANVTLVFAAGSTRVLSFTSATPTIAPIVVSSSDTMPFLPMAFGFPTAFVRPAPENRYKVLEISTAVKTVVAEDFYVRSTQPYGEEFEVESDGTTQSVYIRFPNFVESQNIDNDCALWQNGEDWVNSYDAAVAATNAYWCRWMKSGSFASTQRDTKFKVPFPGLSFSLAAPTDKTFTVLQFHQKKSQQTIDDLRLYDGANWTLANAGNLSLAGNVRVHATDANPAAFTSYWDRNETLNAAFAGDGTLCFIGTRDGNNTDKPYLSTYYLYGDNSRFVGAFDFGPDPRYISNANYQPLSDESNYTTNVIKTASALGGEPPEPTYNSVRLRGTSVLKVMADVDYVRTNRGTYVELAPRLVVDAGKTFGSSCMTVGIRSRHNLI